MYDYGTVLVHEWVSLLVFLKLHYPIQPVSLLCFEESVCIFSLEVNQSWINLLNVEVNISAHNGGRCV